MNGRRVAITLIGAEVGLAALFGIAGATGHMSGVAYAQPDSGLCFDAECPAGEIPLSQIHRSDLWPVCALEDCSDQPGQIGMWLDRSTGNWWLSTGETSLLVVDDTAAPMA